MSTSKKCYFVFKGNIGYYDTKDEALINAGTNKNYLEITTSNTRQALALLLKSVARTRRDIDFDILQPFVSGKDINILKSINKQQIFTVAYMNRLVDDYGNSKYGIWFKNEGHNYCYISDVLQRKHITDEVILLKLNELSNKYGFKGILKTPIPLPDTNPLIPTDWEVEEISCYGFDIPMVSLVEILKGNKSIIPVDYLK